MNLLLALFSRRQEYADFAATTAFCDSERTGPSLMILMHKMLGINLFFARV
jgi:hypothetical protein